MRGIIRTAFKGAVLSYSSGKGALFLHWPVAADNVTSAANMVYNVYVGGSPDPAVIAQKSNLKMTVVSKTAVSVYGLTPGGAYYCLVKAMNEAGNQSLNTGVSAVEVQVADLVAARFTGPTGITTNGTNIYVTEYLNHTVQKVVIATGVVTTLAGSLGTAAQFNMPKGITTDGASLYVADYANHTIRKIK